MGERAADHHPDDAVDELVALGLRPFPGEKSSTVQGSISGFSIGSRLARRTAMAQPPTMLCAGPKGKPVMFVGAVLGHHQDVVLAVAAGPGQALGDHDHRLHRDHHAGLEDGVDVLAQFQPRLAAVVVAEHAEGVAVAEGAVLQQAVVPVDLVELGRDVAAARARPDQLDARADGPRS